MRSFEDMKRSIIRLMHNCISGLSTWSLYLFVSFIIIIFFYILYFTYFNVVHILFSIISNLYASHK